ncbi:MAG: hypothetical protein KDD46_00055 [Bdellovibrionales bacterium]|nr:hypothetical protein [Bdellovibrionales bacterium]
MRSSTIQKGLILLLFCVSCTQNTTIDNQEGENIYVNPDALSFSNEHRAKMLRITYLNLGYTFPADEDMKEILEAADEDAAQLAYEEAIDTLLESGVMHTRMLDYFLKMLGVGNKYSGTAQARYPANLGAYVFINNLAIDEFLTADYAIDDNQNVVSQTYAGGPPTSDQAGYITMEAYTQKYMNTRFMMKMIREIFGLNLNAKAPFAGVTMYRWDENTINPKYTEQPDNETRCIACHAAMNPARGAFHRYMGAYNTYTTSPTQSTNQYGQEDDSGGGSFVLEPLSGGSALSVSQAAQYYKIEEDGIELHTPKDLANALIVHPNFSKAWTERFLTIMLNIDEGSPGQGNVVPNHFSSNEAEELFLEHWAEVFESVGRKPNAFFKAFLKSKTYLVTGANPTDS